MNRCQVKDFLKKESILIDVRSPSEYKQGHYPGALNLPLFSDKEHMEVGSIYKKEGFKNAIQLGLSFVVPRFESISNQLNIWVESQYNIKSYKPVNIRIYCWRGGMRSASIAWLAEVLGYSSTVLEGGYKSFRSWVLEQFSIAWPFVTIGGRTGTGKTDLLLALESQGKSTLDLEGLANHRGSSFGGMGLPPQPSSEHYENLLAIHLYNLATSKKIYLEGESTQIGSCRIPIELWSQMQKSYLIEIQRPIEYRISQLMMTYGVFSQENLSEAINKISRRLGPQRTHSAFEAIGKGDSMNTCRQVLDYYDHCYAFELQRSPQRQSVDLGQRTAKEAVQELITELLIS